jgi:hypothetical protein
VFIQEVIGAVDKSIFFGKPVMTRENKLQPLRHIFYVVIQAE